MSKAVDLEKNFTPEENARADKCAEKIRALLEEDKCVILPVPYIAADGRIVAEVHIVPKRSIEVARLALPGSIQPTGKPILLE